MSSKHACCSFCQLFLCKKRLFPSEMAFAFLGVGGDTFFGVFALEAELLQFALDGETFGEGDFCTGLDGAFDASDGFGSTIGWTELACIIHNLLPVVLGLVNVIDEVEILGLLEAHQL